MTRHDLYVADEIFLSGTAAELIPVIKLDGRSIGAGKPGPVFKNMLERFRRMVVEE
jgi:branched-chain amino acid aminotransferase